MLRTERRAARHALDKRLGTVDRGALTPPTAGWVRAIRDALGLSGRQLGTLLGVTAASVSDLEDSERAGTAQLATLRRAADAMNCELVYAFVPRTSLDDTIHRQAQQVARHELARVNTTMRLEDQGLPDDEIDTRVVQFAETVLDDPALWDERR